MSDTRDAPAAGPDALGAQIDRAFDYRGFVTVSRRDGTKLVGFVYDRGVGRGDGRASHIEMFDEAASQRIRIAIEDIADIELTGEDSAAKAHTIWERRKGTLEPPETSAWGEWADRPILVLVALPLELRSVAHSFGAKPRGATVRGRIGATRAVGLAVGIGGGAAEVIAAQRPRLVISCGLSGALVPSLATGDLVLASSVRDASGDVIAVADPVLRAARQALGDPKPAEGEILCATEIAATPEAKRALARPGRLAVDLESWPAARAAQRARVPWLALRVVFDPLDATLPAFTREVRRSYLGPALRHALGGPRAIAELAQLGWRAHGAQRSLAHALHRLLPMFASIAPSAAVMEPAS